VSTVIEKALEHAGPLVAAWQTWTDAADRGLYVFSVAGGRAKQLAEARVAESGRSAATDDLHRRGIRVGAHDPRNEHVWCADDDGLAVWSASGLRAESAGGELRVGGRAVRRGDVRGVVSFVSEDMVRRGVRLELSDGGEVVIAEDEDSAPLADPTYNADNLAIDASWARYLGAALAKWLGVPHVNQIP
jgi:hypothetical protein